MDNINDLKKSLDDVEQIFITKAIKDKKDIAEAKKAIVKQLDTLILKAETELLEKHFVTPGFISKPAAKVKSVASGVGRVGQAGIKGITSAATKAGKSIAQTYSGVPAGAPKTPKKEDYGRYVSEASKITSPAPKTAEQAEYGRHIASQLGGRIPKAATSAPKSIISAPPVKVPKAPKTSNISATTRKRAPKSSIPPIPKIEEDTGVPHDFGGTTAPTKISKPPESGTSKLMEQASKLERQLTQPKPVAKKTTPKPVDKPAPKPVVKPEPVVAAPKLTPFQEATKKINDTVAAKKATTTQAPAPKQQQTKPVVPFAHIPETPKVNIPTGEIDTKLKTIKEGRPSESSGITAGSGEDTAKQLKRSTAGKSAAL